MIPGLLHGRVLGGGGGPTPPPPSGIIASPGYSSIMAAASGQIAVEAVARFTIRPDGVWEASPDVGTGIPRSGLWYDPQTSGIGAGYEVRMTPTRTAGPGGVIHNEAADWVPLSLPRDFTLTVSRYVLGETYAQFSVLVEIRPVGGSVQSSGVIQVTAVAAVGSSDGPVLQ